MVTQLETEWITSIVQTVFALIAMSRPAYLRDLWQLSDAEAKACAEPVARCLARLDTKTSKRMMEFADPAMAVISIGSSVASRLAAEREIVSRMQQQQQAAAAPQQRPRPSHDTATAPAAAGAWSVR